MTTTSTYDRPGHQFRQRWVLSEVLICLSRGIRANASMVGDGEDIMATVMVGGTAVHSAPIKVADVTEGLIVKVDPVAEGLQCADTDAAMATITIQEGFVDAIVSTVDNPNTTEGIDAE